jgi:hypothetical protein
MPHFNKRIHQIYSTTRPVRGLQHSSCSMLLYLEACFQHLYDVKNVGLHCPAPLPTPPTVLVHKIFYSAQKTTFIAFKSQNCIADIARFKTLNRMGPAKILINSWLEYKRIPNWTVPLSIMCSERQWLLVHLYSRSMP